MIYNLKRDEDKDHWGGRPAIYLGFNEKSNEHKIMTGTTKTKNNKQTALILDLSQKTYFYEEDITYIENTGEKLGDFWSRNLNSNKPINFLNSTDKEIMEKYSVMKEQTSEELPKKPSAEASTSNCTKTLLMKNNMTDIERKITINVREINDIFSNSFFEESKFVNTIAKLIQ